MARTRTNRQAGPLERWARLAHRRRGRVIGAWVFALVALVFANIQFAGEYASEFRLPGSETQKGVDLLEERFPQRDGDSADIVFQANAGVDTPAVRQEIQALLDKVREIPGVIAVDSPLEQGRLVANGGTIARAEIHWAGLAHEIPAESFDRLLAVVDESNSERLRVEVGGSVVIQNEEVEFGSEFLGLIAAAFILLIAFGSVIAMGLPLGAAIFGLGAGFALIGLGTNVMTFPIFSPQFAAMIGLGVGIDYSLLVVTRFREGLHTGLEVEEAVVLALTTAGRSVIFAGLVVAVSFLGLYLMGMPFIAALGTAGAIVVVVSVLVALTLMPALLSLAGKRVDSWRVPFLHSTEGVDPKSGWYRLSVAIQRRPLLYFLGSAAILLFLATPLLGMRLGFTDAGQLPRDYHSRRAYDLLTEGFGPGFNGPILLAVDVSAGGREQLEILVNSVRSSPNIAEVSPPILNPEGDVALITAFPGTAPQDKATDAVIHRLRDEVIPGAVGNSGARVYVTGPIGGNVDASDRIQSRMPLLFGGVIGVSFLLLMVVFRSILVAAKAAIMNLLSIGASYGVVVAIFQWGWLSGLIGVEKGPVEVFLPMMMFAILFGLSMDYEVFLISRVREEYLKTGNNATAVSHGLAATARVITAAAAIMVAVFLTFVLGPDRIIKEFGIGLATAIFVDATVVRLFLVPATMELLGDANWWLPRWLDRVLPHVNLEGSRERAPREGAPAPAGGG